MTGGGYREGSEQPTPRNKDRVSTSVPPDLPVSQGGPSGTKTPAWTLTRGSEDGGPRGERSTSGAGRSGPTLAVWSRSGTGHQCSGFETLQTVTLSGEWAGVSRERWRHGTKGESRGSSWGTRNALISTLSTHASVVLGDPRQPFVSGCPRNTSLTCLPEFVRGSLVVTFLGSPWVLVALVRVSTRPLPPLYPQQSWTSGFPPRVSRPKNGRQETLPHDRPPATTEGLRVTPTRVVTATPPTFEVHVDYPCRITHVEDRGGRGPGTTVLDHPSSTTPLDLTRRSVGCRAVSPSHRPPVGATRRRPGGTGGGRTEGLSRRRASEEGRFPLGERTDGVVSLAPIGRVAVKTQCQHRRHSTRH